MKDSQSNSVILWAIDIFSSETKLQREAAWAIKVLGNKLSFQIQPVYVVVQPTKVQSSTFDEESYKKLHTQAQDKFNQMFKGIKLKSVLPLAILEVQRYSVRDQITALLSYAQEIEAEMIVASTKANQGPTRWILGSFVESLSLRSQIPLFIVNPSWKRKPAFKDILFPTDFSQESYEAFQKIIRFAKRTGSRIHIFHKFVSEALPTWPLAFGWIPPYVSENPEKEEINHLMTKANKWIKKAQNQGVLAKFEIETKGKRSVAEAILRRSKMGSYLIALASRSDAIDASLLGSVTRQLIRLSCDPLWIIHPSLQKDKVVRPDFGNKMEDANRSLASTMI